MKEFRQGAVEYMKGHSEKRANFTDKTFRYQHVLM